MEETRSDSITINTLLRYLIYWRSVKSVAGRRDHPHEINLFPFLFACRNLFFIAGTPTRANFPVRELSVCGFQFSRDRPHK